MRSRVSIPRMRTGSQPPRISSWAQPSCERSRPLFGGCDDTPARAFPRRGKRERGSQTSLLPQAIACPPRLNPVSSHPLRVTARSHSKPGHSHSLKRVNPTSLLAAQRPCVARPPTFAIPAKPTYVKDSCSQPFFHCRYSIYMLYYARTIISTKITKFEPTG
jgi:hypothetical protein